MNEAVAGNTSINEQHLNRELLAWHVMKAICNLRFRKIAKCPFVRQAFHTVLLLDTKIQATISNSCCRT